PARAKRGAEGTSGLQGALGRTSDNGVTSGMRTALLAAISLALLTSAHARSADHGAARAAPKPPELEGLWSVNSTTKLERPSVYPSLVITEAQEKAIPPPPVFPDDDVGQEATEWQDEGSRLA